MPQICTSDMAAQERPREELLPSGQRDTPTIAACALMVNQVYGTREELRNARRGFSGRFPKISPSRYLTRLGGEPPEGQADVSASRARSSGLTTLPVGLRGKASTKTNCRGTL